MPVLSLDCHLPHNTPHIPSRYNNEQTTKQTKAINNSYIYIYIHISCKCDTNRAGHFTLDAYASRPVACSFLTPQPQPNAQAPLSPSNWSALYRRSRLASHELVLVSRYSTVRSETLTWREWGLWPNATCGAKLLQQFNYPPEKIDDETIARCHYFFSKSNGLKCQFESYPVLVHDTMFMR